MLRDATAVSKTSVLLKVSPWPPHNIKRQTVCSHCRPLPLPPAALWPPLICFLLSRHCSKWAFVDWIELVYDWPTTVNLCLVQRMGRALHKVSSSLIDYSPLLFPTAVPDVTPVTAPSSDLSHNAIEPPPITSTDADTSFPPPDKLQMKLGAKSCECLFMDYPPSFMAIEFAHSLQTISLSSECNIRWEHSLSCVAQSLLFPNRLFTPSFLHCCSWCHSCHSSILRSFSRCCWTTSHHIHWCRHQLPSSWRHRCLCANSLFSTFLYVRNVLIEYYILSQRNGL